MGGRRGHGNKRKRTEHDILENDDTTVKQSPDGQAGSVDVQQSNDDRAVTTDPTSTTREPLPSANTDNNTANPSSNTTTTPTHPPTAESHHPSHPPPANDPNTLPSSGKQQRKTYTPAEKASYKRQKREDYRATMQKGGGIGESGLVELPKKRFYRQRAHANPFSDHVLD